MKRSLAVLAAVVLLGAASAEADVTAGTQTTSAGAVSATLGWQAGRGPVNTTLTITRNGAAVFSRPIPDICDDLCVRDADDPDAFQTTDLDGDGEPEILVLGNNADRLDVGEDTRFDDVQPGLETPPARVFEYAAGAKLIDVSRTDGRAEVREDLREHASEIDAIVSGQTARLRGETIAYVADEYVLGRGAFAIKRLDRVITQGRLGTPRSAAAFRKRLSRALRRNGYLMAS